MPRISEKGLYMPASPIRKLVPYAEAAKRSGKKVYHLNIGQPDIPTPQVAIDAIKNASDPVVAYGHSAGNESFRRGLAEYYNNLGLDISYEDILITSGGSEAILFAFMACFNPGDEVIIPEPFYANYWAYAYEAGVNVKPITSSIENDFALPPIEAFERLITPKTKGIFISNPNNPTGCLYGKLDLEKLAEIVKKYDLYLFSDEVYREFCYDGEELTSALKLKGIEQNVVLIDSVSKRYSMCGARIGAIVTKNKDVTAFSLKFGQARLCPPFYGQIAAEAALKAPKEYFQKVHHEYHERRDFMVNALNKIDGVYCPMPKGAFYSLVRLPIDDSDKFAQWLLEEFSYKNQTVMVAPATGFYATLGLGKDEVRMAYVLNIEDLKNAIECLEQALKEYPGRTN
ncbi:MAG: pyridoxal phosphate-dependent aminotransferase [Prevotellaceae bacterium]|jgi:aspartate aminotransferase|nr:pyridoxal phosphate-dependent aminotransferase [Prevotellaceae bacterium]